MGRTQVGTSRSSAVAPEFPFHWGGHMGVHMLIEMKMDALRWVRRNWLDCC
jgi:hypothetical protein